MSALQNALKDLEKFKAAYTSNDLNRAETILGELKLKLIQLTSLPPICEKTLSSAQELSFGRDCYEHAAVYSVRTKDEATMERCFTQVKAFYADTRSLLPKSDQEPILIGLNLLRLLVQNRIAEFHTELELIPVDDHANPGIQYAIQLDQWLMEGAYNKVLQATKAVPSDLHALLLQDVAATVRDEIASCCEKAYEKLRIKDAHKMLLMESEVAVKGYAIEHAWTIQEEYIMFSHEESASLAKEASSLSLINNTLVYAKELERIV
ncbi:hypothetical protein CEUSTIGMA_g6255.t1 [Chlamydomonas eustigma]|uniref:PCI domain-containing protein n=1 Tax=Chlamydomonas eustigma TaxID=1157962 RepID=A0A250X6V9_9CHLO|nr:hypothetical protein CEUSTIGMA_g6255.t1 [Chlamydomonas eustigma]|eukprot:GAX78818.1 hypothetical protein CEUSTIGMA_g6255.t1 [Chlamydomonas eustigma]